MICSDVMLLIQETDLVFDGVAVRVYEPVKKSGVLPGIVYFHGGGFVFGNLGKDYDYCSAVLFVTD